MKISRTVPKKARIEIIPMIDTMFFLLVFFMMATLSMTNQYSLPVNLPNASGVQDKTQEIVTLTITKEGKLFLNKAEIASASEVALQLIERSKNVPQLAVVINADRSVEYGQVVELMDTIQQSGLWKSAIAVNRSAK